MYVLLRPMSQNYQNQTPWNHEFLGVDDVSDAAAYALKQKLMEEQRKLIDLQRRLAMMATPENMRSQLANEMERALQQFGVTDPKRLINVGQAIVPPAPPVVPLDEESPRADDAQAQAIKHMNPIARHKFETLFKLLGIKVRMVNMSRGTGTEWILAKMSSKGMVRQEWSAPSQDPGCSFRTWDAMVSELLDEITRREGIDVKTDHDYSAEGAGDEAGSRIGDTGAHKGSGVTDERHVPVDATAVNVRTHGNIQQDRPSFRGGPEVT